MAVLVTGAAGFIGFHVAAALARAGERVLGVDNLSPYYDVRLKEARLAELQKSPSFSFGRLDIAERGALAKLTAEHRDIDRVVHLAAQAGVRYSLIEPRAYVSANLVGHLEVLEACRAMSGLKHLVYASSSSVYGGNTKLPFSETDPVDTPQSLYAATKKADELMSHCYAHLYRIPTTGLRFFTVYGPWGRPDMAAWLFTKAILAGEPIKLFNHGKMRRDFSGAARARADPARRRARDLRRHRSRIPRFRLPPQDHDRRGPAAVRQVVPGRSRGLSSFSSMRLTAYAP